MDLQSSVDGYRRRAVRSSIRRCAKRQVRNEIGSLILTFGCRALGDG